MKQHGDAGFGMIEIVISILLVGLLAISVLPLLITALKAGAQNAVTAAATQLAADGLARAEHIGLTTCAPIVLLETDFPVFVAGSDAAATHGLTAAFDQLTDCPADPADYPATVSVAVTVSDSNGAVASATQLVFVSAP